MIFSPTLCHRHNVTLCMAGRGASIDGVVTCYRLDFGIWTLGGGDFLFLLPVWTSPGAHPAVFTVGNGPLSWQYSSRCMELITHPNVVLILRISRAIPLLLLCATTGMLWSVLHILHMCGWLFMISWPLPSTYVWLIVHDLCCWCLVPKHHVDIFLVVKINISSTSKWIIQILISSVKRMIPYAPFVTKVKVQQSLYWGDCRRESVPGGWGSQIWRQLAHVGGQFVSPTYCPTLPPRKYSWYSFFQGLSWPQCHNAAC